MIFTYIGKEVTSLNRASVSGELESTATPQELIWGMDPRFYRATEIGTLNPKDQSELGEIELEEERQKALDKLWAYQDQLIEENINGSHTGKKALREAKRIRKINKALRKEVKGNANAADRKMLDDNDAIDDWHTDIDRDALGNKGVRWIEKNNRTFEELVAYNPETDVTWTPFPELEE